jgi:hypothetical protein
MYHISVAKISQLRQPIGVPKLTVLGTPGVTELHACVVRRALGWGRPFRSGASASETRIRTCAAVAVCPVGYVTTLSALRRSSAEWWND